MRIRLAGLDGEIIPNKESNDGKVNFKIPNNLIRKIIENAPSEPPSDGYRRIPGYMPDYTPETCGYKAVCVYIQNGLSDKIELFKEISKGIFKIQMEINQYYPLLICGFGDTLDLQHEKNTLVLDILMI